MNEVAAGNIAGLRPAAGGVNDGARATPRAGISDTVFRDQLAALQGPIGPKVSDLGVAGAGALKFSNHAVDRMQLRGISFSPAEMARIEGAVSKAAAKGAKDTLVLTDSSALIVSVKDNTVVTVMDKASLKDNVFTKIDSTVVI